VFFSHHCGSNKISRIASGARGAFLVFEPQALTELLCLVMVELATLAKHTEWGATYVKS
jgi:hypothetical protein